MDPSEYGKKRNIPRHLFVYLGSAWVVIEALNFLIDKYYWSSEVLDVLILLIIFGLPALVIYLWFERKFSRKAIILHSVNLVITLSVIVFSLVKPGSLNPNEIRLIDFQKNQRKLAENIRSLAILPFSNYTGDEGNESIVFGMHDALINELGRIGAIRVISKTSTLPYAKSEKTVKEIASDLKVDALIEASVLNVSEGIRITVKLVNAVPEQQLWSRTFDSERENVLDLYSQIISNIADQIKLALSPDEVTFLENSRSVDPDAYKAYLTGVYHSETLTERGFNLALENFSGSLELDSLHAPTYAGLAFAWIGALQMRIVTVAEAIPEIYKNNLKALTLDPEYPEAHYIEALMSAQGEWDWQKSEAAFRRAIAGNPNHVLSHAYYSHILMFQKRFEEAFAELETALELDPKNPLVLSLYAVVLWHHGDLDRAVDMSQKARELSPTGTGMQMIVEGVAYLQGNFGVSMEMLEKIYKTRIPGIVRIAKTYEENGYKAAMKELAIQLEEVSHLQAFYIALFYNRAGMQEKAIQWIQRGYEMHDPDMPYAFLPIEMNNLRSDPRYAELARKMKLPL